MEIKNKNFVNPDTIKTYSEIDGLRVIEECLLFKGTDYVRVRMSIPIKHLEDTALVVYGLSVTATNKLYVGMHLDKFYKRNGMVATAGNIKIPVDIFKRVDELHKSYQTLHNQNDK